VPPGPLRELKDLMYRLYVVAGTPSLDDIHAAAERERTDAVAGWPGRDTIRRIIADAVVPPSQADVVAVATVLARMARWDPADAADRVRELWVQAQTAVPVGVKPTGFGEVDVPRLRWRRLAGILMLLTMRRDSECPVVIPPSSGVRCWTS
jgi:hypothetical protein